MDPQQQRTFAVYDRLGARVASGSAIRISRQMHEDCVFYANKRCTLKLLSEGGFRPRRLFIGTPNEVCMFLLRYSRRML